MPKKEQQVFYQHLRSPGSPGELIINSVATIVLDGVSLFLQVITLKGGRTLCSAQDKGFSP
jgi:hypothetical protein